MLTEKLCFTEFSSGNCGSSWWLPEYHTMQLMKHLYAESMWCVKSDGITWLTSEWLRKVAPLHKIASVHRWIRLSIRLVHKSLLGDRTDRQMQF